MKTVCIISALHLVNNPRVWKEANSLAAAGYRVVILTVCTSIDKYNQDLGLLHSDNIILKTPVVTAKVNGSFVKPFVLRVTSKVARFAKRFLKIDNSWLLGHAPRTMLRAALKENADLYIVHVEYGFFVGSKLVEEGKKVAFDFEDWYSQDYHVPGRPIKMLQNLESFALRSGVFCTCPSFTMASALCNHYKSASAVKVIYNGFSSAENMQGQPAPNSLVWFSQTIGPGRGLETIVKSLQYLTTRVKLTLLGNCIPGYDIQLKSIFPFNRGHELEFHQPVAHHQLTRILSQFEIGLAIENNFPENKNTTISNKILQYLQAGVKVLATNTAGQAEVQAHFKDVIELVPVNDPEVWALAIERLMQKKINDADVLLKNFDEIFSWEEQEKKLLSLVDSVLV